MKDEKKSEVKLKRFSLSKEEREKIQNIQSVMGILGIQREGLQHSMMLELAKARARLDIKDNEAPDGYVRNVDFDPQTYELLVRDFPKPPEPKEKVKEESKLN